MTQLFYDNPAERIDPHDADTIEMELTAEQMLALTRAAEPEEPAPIAAGPVISPEPIVFAPEPIVWAEPPAAIAPAAAGVLPIDRPLLSIKPVTVPASQARPRAAWSARRWLAGIAAITIVSLAAGINAYLATKPQPPVQVVVPAVPGAVAPEPPAPPAPETTPVRFTNPFDPEEIFEFPSGTSDAEARQAVADLLLERARERQPAAQEARPRVAATKLARRN